MTDSEIRAIAEEILRLHREMNQAKSPREHLELGSQLGDILDESSPVLARALIACEKERERYREALGRIANDHAEGAIAGNYQRWAREALEAGAK